MENGENNDLNASQNEKKSSKLGANNPFRNVQDKAQQVQNISQGGQSILNKQAQKQMEKAATQQGAKAVKTAERAAKNAKRAERLGKISTQAAKVGKIAAKLGKILIKIGWILLIIIAIIGLLVFIITGLGLIMSGLKDIARAFGDKLVAFVYGSENIVHDDEILDTLSYLEEMDYDLYGYGFSTVPDPLTEEQDENGEIKKKLTYPSDEWHWTFFSAMNAAIKHTNAYKYIRAYLISDNYAYILKHQNRTLGDYFASFVTGNDIMGEGLLGVYYEEEVGKLANPPNPYKKSDLGSITVSNGKLKITEAGLIKRTIMEYDLDGWTGRYGMPLEFLLSIHLATMAPDLSYRMATAFDTEVQIGLHKIENGNVNSGAGSSTSSMITFSDFQEIAGSFFGDDWRLNAREAQEMFIKANGIIESYRGDNPDLNKYKCLGPPNYTDMSSDPNIEVNTEGVTKEQISEQINALLNTDSGVAIDSAEVDNMINDISTDFSNYFQEYLNSNGYASLNMPISEETLAKLTAQMTVDSNQVISRSQPFTVKFSFAGQIGENYVFRLGDETFKVKALKDGEDPFSEERKKRLIESLTNQIDESKYLVAESERQAETMISSVLGSSEPFDYNIEVGINNQDDEENSNNNGGGNNGGDTQQNQVSDNTWEYCLEGSYNGEADFIFKFTVTFVSNNDGSGRLIFSLARNDTTINPETYCSEDTRTDEGDIACTHCIAYLKDIYKALKATNNSDLDTYLPYIYRVKGHWFRDVYFSKYAIDDAGPNTVIVENDDDYEEKTGERWTLYEVYEDGDNKGEYKLYAYFKNGNDYDVKLSDVLCEKVKKGEGKYKLSEDGITYVKATGKEGEYNLSDGRNVDEFRVGKKAIEDTEIKNREEIYNAYQFGESDQSWRTVEVDANSDQYLRDLKAAGVNIYYQATFGNVQQVEDGVRGETNPTIKKIFLDDYYLYDGTRSTAALIQKAKEITGSDNPTAYDRSRGKIKTELVDKIKKFENGEESTETVTREYTATIDQISGPISLSHSALSAFSILENMHTLDSEFIYHDFKELIVELNYFDKEDLSEPEDEVMMFPLSGVSSAGWPVTRYDKGEQFYGTLIHSAQDLRALKAKTISEIMELLNEEEIPDNSSTEEQPTNNEENGQVQETNSNNPLVLAAADVAKILVPNGYYCQGRQEKCGGHSPYASHFRATTLEELQQTPLVDCSGYVSICLQEVGVLEKGTSLSSGNFVDNLQGATIISSPSIDQLQPGMICVYDGHVNIYAGNNLFYDWGSKKESEPISYTESILYAIQINPQEMTYNGITGTASGSTPASAEFTGFEGGETVVAPVSGLVEKYGTVTRQKIKDGEEQDVEVGFIKIRILGKEEGKVKTGGTISGVTHQAISANDVENNNPGSWLETTYSEEQLDKLGYDYFWEEYNNAGIGDYVVYLEGFDVSDITAMTGTEIKGKKKANITALHKYIKGDADNNYTTSYAVPNLLDDTREYELKIEESAKEKAAFTFKKDDLIYIKEGAAIGKTFPEDSDFMEELQIDLPEPTNPSTPDDTEEPTEEEEEARPYKVGNYLRMMLRDEKDEIVENVEEYVEIDKPGGSSEAGLYAGFNAEVTKEEKEMLAAVILAENGNHMDAVCQVVKNRGNDTVHNGDVTTISDVLTKSGQYGTVFPVGGNNNPSRQGGYGTAPNGTYTRIYDLGEYGQFVVGNQASGGSFTERLATEESKSIVEGVLSGAIEDVVSPRLGKLALFQVTLGAYPAHLGEPECVENGELFSHLWGPLTGNPQSCSCTLSN